MVTTMKIFTCLYIKKSLKNVFAFLIKLSASSKQLIRSNSICSLKNQAILYHRVSIEIGLTPLLPLFVFIRSLRIPLLPLFLHNKSVVKKGLLEEMKGVNDDASAFMHLNIKANK